MIEKQRLEELIEQSATIYGKIYGDILAIELSKKNKPEIKYDDRLDVYCTSNEWRNKMQFCYLWETEEDARWELEMTATRTETLKLPSFNELQTKKEYYKNFALYFYLAIDMPYKKDTGAVIISQNDLKGNSYIIFDKPLTKENYIKACKICRKLFLGEEI